METFKNYKSINYSWATGSNGLRLDLQKEFKTVRDAAKYLNVSYTNLSRIINGKPHELKTHVEILIAVGVLPDSRYIFPQEDMHTFELLNKLR